MPRRRDRLRLVLGTLRRVLAGGTMLGSVVIGCKRVPTEVRIAKWRDGHRAAISITYDESDLVSPSQIDVHEAVVSLGMHIDFELVTGDLPAEKQERIRWLVARGFQFFGHGAQHVNHDELSEEALKWSTTTCYDTMKRLGLRPVAFAYPGGHGNRSRTRVAVREAGFLSGRMFRANERQNPYIVPDDVREPSDWYALPTLVMMGPDFDVERRAVNDTAELIPYLDGALRRTAWIITTYHSINEPQGYAFYPLETFRADLEAIKARDFWVASINDATLYIRERAAARIAYRWIDRENEHVALEVSIDDGLPDDVYDVPLTVAVRAPASWRGRRVMVSNVRTRRSQDVPADGAPLMVDVRPDGTTSRIKLHRRGTPQSLAGPGSPG